ncbi:MAG TPA: GlsB/YeaQ/YmgE family stress response membrane protein [Candidatus Limnocylindria bacterium]
MGIIGWIIIGLIAGAIARWIMPGADPMGWLGTIVLGIVGSFVGGFVLNLVTGNGMELSPSGIIGSILGALIVLFIWRRMRPGARVA